MKCVGLYYRTAAEQTRAMNLKPGEALRLEPEPTNPFDPNAVKVLTEDGFHIGYVSKDEAPFLKGDHLPHGIFQEFVQISDGAVHLYFDPEYDEDAES